MRPLSRHIVAFALLLTSGCNLAESAADLPFSPVVLLTDGGRDTGRDVPPLPPPELIFTEVMLDAPGQDPMFNERGEFIEIKNIGAGPADPREIVLFLTTDGTLTARRIQVAEPFGVEETRVVTGLQPIQPQDYFVFIRHEDAAVMPVTDALPPGTAYDYGVYAAGPALPHEGFAKHQLDLGYRYRDGTTEVFDSIRWSGHDFFAADETGKPVFYAEGVSVSLAAEFENSVDNDAPQNWCPSTTNTGGALATPGTAATCP